MKKYSYNTDKYRFRELVSELYQVDELEKIHKNKSEWVRDEYKGMTLHEENSTDFHDTFYKRLNDNWTDLYESYDKFIHDEIVPIMDEKFHYQYLPSFRVQLPDENQAVHTWHCDSDPLHKHPKGEINIWLPLTRCYGTNTMWIESEPFKLDFQPLEGDYGNFWTNNGNVCMHGNKPNVTSVTRMSFDFRVIPLSKYNPNYSVTSDNHSHKFVVGGYYKEL
jgi:hypothetical protein